MTAPNPTIIAILERALDDARSGRTRAIAFAQLGDGDEWLTYFNFPDGDIADGERLQRVIAQSFDEVTTAVMEERAKALAEALRP